jgi:hypothetical protein
MASSWASPGATTATLRHFTSPGGDRGLKWEPWIQAGEGSNDTFFVSGTFRAVFTADNGKSTTLFAAGPTKSTSPPVIDALAGTITFRTTYVGLPEKLSITLGPTLSRDAGTVTFVDVFEYTGDPDDPVGDFISSDLTRLHGPHPDLLSDFEVFCDVLEPYLLDP